jgi:glycosyltransferase A (GT-A) superfamily protein (DUF2064 family)
VAGDPGLLGGDAVVTDAATTVVVLAKEPQPGRVMTLLQRVFTPEQAAELAACALEDTLAAVEAAAPAYRLVAWDGTGTDWRDRLANRGFAVVPQGAGLLNDRLTTALTAARSTDPNGRLLVIGMDTPQVTADLLRADWGGADAVFGPAEDGGFWALGLRAADPAPCLAGIPMSTERTGAAQLARLVELGLSINLLPSLCDVDEPADAAAVAARAPDLSFSRRHRQLVGPPAPATG